MHRAKCSRDGDGRGSQPNRRETRTGVRRERSDPRARARHDHRLAAACQPLEVPGRDELVTPRGRDDQVESCGDTRIRELRGRSGPRGNQGVVTEDHGRERMIPARAPPLCCCCVHEFG